jgi:hypothetical protein
LAHAGIVKFLAAESEVTDWSADDVDEGVFILNFLSGEFIPEMSTPLLIFSGTVSIFVKCSVKNMKRARISICESTLYHDCINFAAPLLVIGLS